MLKHIPAAVLDSHLALLGKTGTGKSGGIKAAIVEPLLKRGERVWVVDPTSQYWGLRLTPDKKPSGFNIIIFGGPHGDMPITARDGEALAEAVGTSTDSGIIDTSLMKPADRNTFWIDFAETILRTVRGRLYLVIDEVHLFAPQQGAQGGGNTPNMLHATNNLVSLGRGLGVSIVMASQRPAKVHKDSVTQCETMMAMRMPHPLDQAAVEDWIGLARIRRMKNAPPKFLQQAEDMMGALAFLPDREAFVWAPDPKIDIFDKIRFPDFTTFDSGALKNRSTGNVKLQPLDLTKFKGKLQQVAEAKKANDPAELRKTIVGLTRELETLKSAGAHTTSADPEALRKAEERGFEQAKKKLEASMERNTLRAIGSAIGTLRAGFTEWGKTLEAGLVDVARRERDLVKLEVEFSATPTSSAAARPRPVGRPDGLAQRTPPKLARAVVSNGSYTTPQMKVLRALAFWQSVGHEQPTRAMVAGVAGYKFTSGGFANLLGGLNTAGAITYPASGRIALAVDGIDVMATDEARELMLGVLSAPQRKIIDALADGVEQTRAALGEATDYSPTSGGFANLLGSLRTLGIIDYPSTGVVQIEPWAADLFR